MTTRGTPVAIQVVDLGFGDSGKGTMVDYLARARGADLVVRFNGGPQAGHNVVLPDGTHHTFSQLGSATFVPGVRTLLSRFMLIEPYAMLNEARHLESVGVPDAMARMLIDARCRVITPVQQIANRVRERWRGSAAHGTCGMGVGECVQDDLAHPDQTLHACDLANATTLRRKLSAQLERKRGEMAPMSSVMTRDERRVLDDLAWIDVAIDACRAVGKRARVIERSDDVISSSRGIVFEGAQGVLLDERFGFAPHTTWSDTTFANADTLLDEACPGAPRERVGVTRCYLTRHGAGPLVSETESLASLAEPHNSDHGAQGRFRRGWLDLVMLRYALSVCGGVDALAVTHLDRLAATAGNVCTGYSLGSTMVADLPIDPVPSCAWLASAGCVLQRWAVEPDAFVRELQGQTLTPVRYRSFGATHLEKSGLAGA